MSIVTDITVDIIINNVKVDEYELSDTLDNYTIDEIFNNGYCGAFNPARRNNFERTTDYGWNVGFDVNNGTFRFPFTTQSAGSTYNWMSGDTGYNAPEGLYSCIVWLKKESAGNPAYVINSDNIADYRIVTKWNINKFVYVLPSLDINFAQIASNTWAEQKTYPTAYYAPGRGSMTYHTNRGEADDETTVITLYPYLLFSFNDTIYFHAIDQDMDYSMFFSTAINLGGTPAEFAGSNASSFDKTTSIGTSYNSNYQAPVAGTSGYNSDFQLSGYPGNNRGTFQWQGPGGYTRWYQISGEDEQNYICGWDHSGYAYQGGYIRIHWLFSKLHDSLLFFANSGVYFQADKIYKPLITNGIVTDYTDDLTTVSDIDDWDGTTYHDIPITPPVPPVDPDEDIETEMTLSAAPYGAGLTHYYVCTKGSGVLSQIADAMSTWDIQNTGKDLFKNMISCKLVKIGAIPAENSTFVIYGEELQYQGSPITIQAVTGNPTMDLGSYTISRKFNDFRDYAPFTKIEIFVPFCGWLPLPSHCIGKTISGELIIDIINATCKAVIKCGSSVVAEGAGVCGIDIPFVAENVGMKLAGIANSITSYGKTAAGAVGSVAGSGSSAGAGAAAVGAVVGMVGAYSQVEQALNANYTEICGKTADGCNCGGLTNVYIKIQRPKSGGFSAPYYVPDNYAHSTGFIAMKQKKVKECSGLTVCNNVDTSSISGATKREREEIKRLLETGVIV